MTNRTVHLIVRDNAIGKILEAAATQQFTKMDVITHVDPDIDVLVPMLKDDSLTRIIFMAIEHSAVVDTLRGIRNVPNSRGHVRKDIYVVSHTVTNGLNGEAQYNVALKDLKRSSSNLVFTQDTATGRFMVVTPEEASYHETTDATEVLQNLAEIAYWRTQANFTRSDVIAGELVPWESEEVPSSLRTVVNHCIEGGAYRTVNGVTAGHFAVKLDDTTFLTSVRKTNFNQLKEVGLVRIETTGDDEVIAYGRKPSVGGQSQRKVFSQHEGMDCIAHFHCPIREGSEVPIVSQREYECGSHECGQNTSDGLKDFGNGIKAVFLNNHGPNIVFSSETDPQLVIDFIEANFDLSHKTGGYQVEKEPLAA